MECRTTGMKTMWTLVAGPSSPARLKTLSLASEGAPSQSLSASLSEAVGNLTNLRQVLLQNNNISGKIPPELDTLPRLQTLDLSNNRLSGVIPGFLDQLDSLQYLGRQLDVSMQCN
ncbi:probable LRR receptor-like serine/threonine-protein kinase At4g30520 [Alnus glutinosa]|uniref:probable LRR receptor-like serine/threonine-protein kinase At4g30520 n=1 Tax=Alnus glutinosa TaxID=3517 RepID=UPI002D7922A0|nr:probable LRR receptor-like serine/threonine-protein kinase At4g30520 [Alnus glutinosa]